jgi:hypothetical protein
LKIKGDALVDTVRLLAASPSPRRLAIAIQLQGAVQLPEGFEAAPAFALPYWQGARTLQMGREAVFPVVYGGLRMELSVKGSGAMKVTHASVPDAPPGRREALYLEVTGNEAQFETIFKPAAPVAAGAEGSRR